MVMWKLAVMLEPTNHYPGCYANLMSETPDFRLVKDIRAKESIIFRAWDQEIGGESVGLNLFLGSDIFIRLDEYIPLAVMQYMSGLMKEREP